MMTLLFISAMFLMIMGVPIAMTIGLVSIVYILINDIPVNIITQQIIGGINVTALLAIPLFILAGDIMGKGGLAKRMIRLASSLVGKVSGGLGIVTVIGCMFFSAISGSGVATTAALGSLMIPAMVNQGYDRGFASSIVATASPLGVIIPPSISFIIYSSLTGTSVSDLYKVGLPAGLIMGFTLMIIVYFLSKRYEYKPEDKAFDSQEFWSALKESIWALGTPLILIGGVFGGVFTPTESAVAAVAYALFVGLFIYKDLKFKDILPIFFSSAKLTGNIMFIIANASLLAWVLTAEGLPQKIVGGFLSITENAIILLIIINMLMLVIGLFMETAAILIILVPLFLPVVVALGMDPLHFGIIVTINTAIGLATPPFGVCLFTAASVGNVSIQRISKYIILPIIMMIIVLMVITFVPELVMFLV